MPVRLPIFCLALLCATAAQAQRANDNAVRQAQDAFGTTVGSESIGLYAPNDVRGFSPVQAGNVRLEGLYFDRQADPGERLTASSTIHVGLSAQSYAFPAPTGIADYHLRLPGDAAIVSAVAGYGAYDEHFLEIDAKIPIVTEQLSLGLGAGGRRRVWDYGAGQNLWTGAILAHWRPSDRIELIPFWSARRLTELDAKPYPVAGGAVPPRIDRRVFYGQRWADWRTREANYGGIAKVQLAPDWLARAGLFRSIMDKPSQVFDLFQNLDASGFADHVAVAYAPQHADSLSGEVRLAHSFREGERRHIVQAAMRGRDRHKLFDGAEARSLGKARVGVSAPVPEPDFALGPRSRDYTRQLTGGLSYAVAWEAGGEIGVGIQRTRYRRLLARPLLAASRGGASPWLYNGTIAALASEDLIFYAGYTRGLEESGDAPANARNRGEVVPASLTRQIDAGIRYALAPGLRLVAGLFEVRKPYFNLNEDALFTALGTVRHRGGEISLTGRLADGLTVVAGAVFLQARVSGASVAQGRIGAIPLGRFPRVARLYTEYAPAAWGGLSVDGQVQNFSSRVASFDNRLHLPGSTLLNIGLRYRFKIGGAPTTLRLQAMNLTDDFTWNVNATGQYEPNERRRFAASIAIDL